MIRSLEYYLKEEMGQTTPEELSPILEPISEPIKGKFPERYKLHQYWSRKPWYVIRQYIEHYTKEGDRILDPFVGSGVTACEALITRRKVIAMDLNPIAMLITKITCLSPVDLNKFRDAFKKIEKNISEEISPLYETNCPNCNKKAMIINTIWKKSDISTIFYWCKYCNSKKLKKTDSEDEKKIKEIEEKEVPFWYPKDVRLPKDADVKTLDQLFTKRNLISLSIIYNEIQRLEEGEIKEIMKLVFSSILVRTSKLIFVNNYRLNKGVNPAGVWGEKRFWVPERYVENNVLYYFKERLLRFIKAKKETNALIGNYIKEGNTFKISTQSATDLSTIPSNSIDYCFTDPPYGGSVQYLDLSTIWNAWLQFDVDYANEIIVKNDSVTRYKEMLTKAFHEIYRVLKPDKFMSVTFHSSNISVWNALISACQDAGFELVNIVPQTPIKRTHNQIELKGTVKTDLIATFKKPYQKFILQQEEGIINIRDIVLTETTNLLEKVHVATTAEIYDAVILKWINIAYRNPKIPKNVKISLNDIAEILRRNNNFENFSE
ncbi:MAG: DNA methyltransferase, partial [Methanophagales archaeon]|nr:DNA methyltransferase [Methanophagales archaeon]